MYFLRIAMFAAATVGSVPLPARPNPHPGEATQDTLPRGPVRDTAGLGEQRTTQFVLRRVLVIC